MGAIASLLEPTAEMIFLQGDKKELFKNKFFEPHLQKVFHKNENAVPTKISLSSTFLLDLFNNYKTMTTAKSDLEFAEKVLIPLLKLTVAENDGFIVYSHQLMKFEDERNKLFNVDFMNEIRNSTNIVPVVQTNEFKGISKSLILDVDVTKIKNLNDASDITNYYNTLFGSKSGISFHFTSTKAIKELNSHVLDLYDKIFDSCSPQLIHDTFLLGVTSGDLEAMIKSIKYSYGNTNKIPQRRTKEIFPQPSVSFRANLKLDKETGRFIVNQIDLDENVAVHSTVIGDNAYTIAKGPLLYIVDLTENGKDKSERIEKIKLPLPKDNHYSLFSINTKLIIIGDDDIYFLETYPRLNTVIVKVNISDECILHDLAIASDGQYLYQITPDNSQMNYRLRVFDIDSENGLRLVKSIPIRRGIKPLQEPLDNSLLPMELLKNARAFCDGMTFSFFIGTKKTNQGFLIFVRSFSVIDGTFVGDSPFLSEFVIHSMIFVPEKRVYWTAQAIKDSYGYIRHSYNGHESPNIINLSPISLMDTNELRMKFNESQIQLNDFAFMAATYIAKILMPLVGLNYDKLSNNFPCEFALFKNPRITDAAIKTLTKVFNRNKTNKINEQDVLLVEEMFLIIAVNRTATQFTDETNAKELINIINIGRKHDGFQHFLDKYLVVCCKSLFATCPECAAEVFKPMILDICPIYLNLFIDRNCDSTIFPFILDTGEKHELISQVFNQNIYYQKFFFELYIISVYKNAIAESEKTGESRNKAIDIMINFTKIMCKETENYFKEKRGNETKEKYISLFLICLSSQCNVKESAAKLLKPLYSLYDCASKNTSYFASRSYEFTIQYKIYVQIFRHIIQCLQTLMTPPKAIPSMKYKKLLNYFLSSTSDSGSVKKEVDYEKLMNDIYKGVANPRNKMMKKPDKIFEGTLVMEITQVLGCSELLDKLPTVDPKLKPIIQMIYKIRTNLLESKHLTIAYDELAEKPTPTLKQQYPIYKKQIADKIHHLVNIEIKLENTDENIKLIYDYSNDEISLEHLNDCISHIKELKSNANVAFITLNLLISNKFTPIPFIYTICNELQFSNAISPTIDIIASFADASDEIVNYITYVANSLISLIPKVNQTTVLYVVSNIITLLNKFNASDRIWKIINTCIKTMTTVMKEIDDFTMEFDIVFILLLQGILLRNNSIKPGKEEMTVQEEILNLFSSYPQFSFYVATALSISGHTKSLESIPGESIFALFKTNSIDFHGLMLYLYEYIVHSNDEQLRNSLYLYFISLIGTVFCGTSPNILPGYVSIEFISLAKTKVMCKTPEMLMSIAHDAIDLLRKLLLSDKEEEIKSLFVKIILKNSNESDAVKEKVGVLAVLSNSLEAKRSSCLMKVKYENDFYYVNSINNSKIKTYMLPISGSIKEKEFQNGDNEFHSLIPFTPSMCNVFQILLNLFSNAMKKDTNFSDSILTLFSLSCLRGFLSDPNEGDSYCAQLITTMEQKSINRFEFNDYSKDIQRLITSFLNRSFEGAFSISQNILEFRPASYSEVVEHKEFKISPNRIETMNAPHVFLTPILENNTKFTVSLNGTKSLFGIVMYDININREIVIYYSSNDNSIYSNGTQIYTRTNTKVQNEISFIFLPQDQNENNHNLTIAFKEKEKVIYINLPTNCTCSYFIVAPPNQTIDYSLTDDNVKDAEEKSFFSFFSKKKEQETPTKTQGTTTQYHMMEQIRYIQEENTRNFYTKGSNDFINPELKTTCPQFCFNTDVEFVPLDQTYLVYSRRKDEIIGLNRFTGEITKGREKSVRIVGISSCPQIHFSNYPQMPTDITNVFMTGVSDAFRNEINTFTVSKLISSKSNPIELSLKIFNLTEDLMVSLISKILLILEPLKKVNLRDQRSPVEFHKVNILSSNFTITNENMYDHYIGVKSLIGYITEEKKIQDFMNAWFNSLTTALNKPYMHFARQGNPFIKVDSRSKVFIPKSGCFIFSPVFGNLSIPIMYSPNFLYPLSRERNTNYVYADSRVESVSSFNKTIVILPYNFESNEPLLDTFFECVVSLKYFIIILSENFEKLDRTWIFDSVFALVEQLIYAVIAYSPFYYSHWQDVFGFIFSRISFCPSDVPQEFINNLNKLIGTIPRQLDSFKKFLNNFKLLCNNEMYNKYLPVFRSFAQSEISENVRESARRKFKLPQPIIGTNVLNADKFQEIKRILTPYRTIKDFPFYLLMTDWAISFSLYPPADITVIQNNVIKVELKKSSGIRNLGLSMPKPTTCATTVSISSQENFGNAKRSSVYNFIAPGSVFYVKFGENDDISNIKFTLVSCEKPDYEETLINFSDEFEKDVKIFCEEFTEKDDQTILADYQLEFFKAKILDMRELSDHFPQKSVFSREKETHMIDLRSRVLLTFNWIIRQFNNIMNEEGTSLLKRYTSMFTTITELKNLLSITNKDKKGEVFIDRSRAMAVRDGISKNLNDSMIAQFAEQYKNPSDFMNEKQPFKVKFKDEKGIDAGGLSREFTSELVKDIMDKNVGLFIETPNSRNKHGQYRECIVPYQATLLATENKEEDNENPTQFSDIKQIYRAVGGLIAISVRSTMVQPFNFPPLFWKYLCYGDISIQDIFAIDEQYATFIKSLENGVNTLSHLEFKEQFPALDNTLVNMKGEKIILSQIPTVVTQVTCQRYISACNRYRLSEVKMPMEYIRNGFLEGLCLIGFPPSVTPEILEFVSCGEKLISVPKLKNLTKFEDISERMQGMFWTSLNRMNEEQKRKFLQFSTGTTSIPPNAEFPFLTVDSMESSKPDVTLPTASTCFFKLHMPYFTNANAMYEKLCKAIEYGFSFENA